MANVQRVIKLIGVEDLNVKLSCFNDSLKAQSSEELYNSWIEFIKRGLGNCCFTGEDCALITLCEDGATFPHPVRSTEDVICIAMDFFDTPKTFRLEIVTPHNTAFSWLFVLTSDLTE